VDPTPSFGPLSTTKFLSLESLFDTFDTPSLVKSSIEQEEEEEEEGATTKSTPETFQEVRTITDNFFRKGPALFPTGTHSSCLTGQSHEKVCEIVIWDVSFGPN
jgi:hypothetical protein